MTPCFVIASVYVTAFGESLHYIPRELFEVRFGTQSYQLGRNVREGEFNGPLRFIVGENEHFYIDDLSNTRVAEYDNMGKFLTAFVFPSSDQIKEIVLDADEHLWIIAENDIKQMFNYLVYDKHGQLLKASDLPVDLNVIRSFRTSNNRFITCFSHAERPSGGAYKETSEKSTCFRIDSIQLVLEPINLENFGHSGDALGNPESRLDFSATPRPRIFVSNGSMKKSLSGILRIAKDGRMFKQRSLREFEVYNSSCDLEVTTLIGGFSHTGKFIDANGDIYQMDYMPDVSDAMLKPMTHIPSTQDVEDLHYSVDMPGIRMIKWERK